MADSPSGKSQILRAGCSSRSHRRSTLFTRCRQCMVLACDGLSRPGDVYWTKSSDILIRFGHLGIVVHRVYQAMGGFCSAKFFFPAGHTNLDLEVCLVGRGALDAVGGNPEKCQKQARGTKVGLYPWHCSRCSCCWMAGFSQPLATLKGASQPARYCGPTSPGLAADSDGYSLSPNYPRTCVWTASDKHWTPKSSGAAYGAPLQRFCATSLVNDSQQPP